jgi:hypothetical protein
MEYNIILRKSSKEVLIRTFCALVRDFPEDNWVIIDKIMILRILIGMIVRTSNNTTSRIQMPVI